MINDSFNVDSMDPLLMGGTGSLSDQIIQPNFLPDKYESGTPNMAGIAGLCRGIDFVNQHGIEKIFLHKRELTDYFYYLCKEIPKVLTYVRPEHIETGTISFNIDGVSSSELGFILSDRYNIQTRIGLHCSPLAHQAMDTFPEGTVRISFSVYSRKEDIDLLIEALRQVSCE